MQLILERGLRLGNLEVKIVKIIRVTMQLILERGLRPDRG